MNRSVYPAFVSNSKASILHICGRSMIRDLRDEILRLNGYEVVSTVSLQEAPLLFSTRSYKAVLIDVEGQGRVSAAEQLCGEIKKESPSQLVAFVCNYRVAIDSDCPDEIIRSEFNPQAFVDGVKHLVQ